MNVHEYQAKKLLQHYGISVPPYFILETIEDLEAAVRFLEGKPAVLKIQVHAGGRGKAGGVKLVHSKEEIYQEVKRMLGMRFVNNQTSAEGIIVDKLMLTPQIDYIKEYYLGAIIDRKQARPLLIASPEGGMDIEQVAHQTPEKILTLPISLSGTLRQYQLVRLAKFMHWTGETARQGIQVAKALAKAFLENDASLLEINPFVQTKEGSMIALDAKLSVDDNALFRHPDLAALFDPSQIPSSEVEAQKHDLAYIALNGSIGCMVNGAGLAMATMDLIDYFGGKAANFLDVGGSASEEKIAAGFKILIQDPQVKAIFVNIFGGIMNCETLAQGILSAALECEIQQPVVVRMEGTHVEQGRALLVNSGLPMHVVPSLIEAAQKVVQVAQK